MFSQIFLYLLLGALVLVLMLLVFYPGRHFEGKEVGIERREDDDIGDEA